jgi:hypothetical protein
MNVDTVGIRWFKWYRDLLEKDVIEKFIHGSRVDLTRVRKRSEFYPCLIRDIMLPVTICYL